MRSLVICILPVWKEMTFYQKFLFLFSISVESVKMKHCVVLKMFFQTCSNYCLHFWITQLVHTLTFYIYLMSCFEGNLLLLMKNHKSEELLLLSPKPITNWIVFWVSVKSRTDREIRGYVEWVYESRGDPRYSGLGTEDWDCLLPWTPCQGITPPDYSSEPEEAKDVRGRRWGSGEETLQYSFKR